MINSMNLIVFLHIVSAIVWVGGMIAIRFAFHYASTVIEEPKVKLAITLQLLKRFFVITSVFIFVLILTAVYMSVEFGLNKSDLSNMAHTKEAIYMIMTFVFIIIVKKRNQAQAFYDVDEFGKCKQTLLPIAKYLIPINIVLSFVAIYLGVLLRGL